MEDKATQSKVSSKLAIINKLLDSLKIDIAENLKIATENNNVLICSDSSLSNEDGKKLEIRGWFINNEDGKKLEIRGWFINIIDTFLGL